MAKTEISEMTGQERAAVLMLALGEESATRLFTLMDEEEIKELSQTMASLGTVSSEVVETLFVEFVNQMTSTASLSGTFSSTERLLTKILPEDQVDAIMDEIRGPAGRTMWDKLGNVSEAVLANYLKNEYPQTVAVILSKIKSEHAARVLAVLPESFSMEVVTRMLRMEAVQKDVLDAIEKTLRTEFMSNLARTSRRDAHEVMAEIFNNLDRNTESRMMEALEERNRDAAEKIKALMFTFDDLVKLDATGIQTLLRGIEKEKLGLALKGGSDEVKELFFSNMSERAGKILKEDMETLGPVRMRDVDEAQAAIIVTTKDLAAKGELVISDDKGDDELVY